MSADTLLSEENEALGSEFCSGYMDSTGKWNNGFYCPGESTEEQFCCGTTTLKYCCPQREHVVTEEFSSLPLVMGVVFGVVAAVVLVTIVSCCFCSCCILYKKRQPRLNGGPLYRMHCSSTASGVANMYSFSNPNSLATTPLDSAVASSHLLVDLEPVISHSLVPNDARSTMSRVHTFSRESRSTEIDLDVNELEMNNQGECRAPGTRSGLRSPEPPPPYDSSGSFSMREDIHRNPSVPAVLSHGTSFSQQTFNPTTHPSSNQGFHPSSSVITQTANFETSQLESQLTSNSQAFSSVENMSLTPGSRMGTSFNSALISESNACSTVNEPVTGNHAIPAQNAGSVILTKSSVQSQADNGAKSHDALYHSTKF